MCETYIQYSLYRLLDAKSRRLVNRYGSKCDHDSYNVIERLYDNEEGLTDALTHDGALALMTLRYWKLVHERRRINREFRKKFRKYVKYAGRKPVYKNV